MPPRRARHFRLELAAKRRERVSRRAYLRHFVQARGRIRKDGSVPVQHFVIAVRNQSLLWPFEDRFKQSHSSPFISSAFSRTKRKAVAAFMGGSAFLFF
jgi:hypothetical protein